MTKNIRRLLSAMALCGVANPAIAADPSLQDLQKQEEAARKAYENARALRLTREITDGESDLAAKRAELAKLSGAAPPSPQIVAQKPDSPVDVTPSQLTTADVAQAAAKTNTQVTAEVTQDGARKTEKVSAKPWSQQDMRDGAATRDFGGIKFGIGLAYTLDTGKYQRVKEAEVVNNIVRVKQSEQSSARIVLESHYFLTPIWPGLNDFMSSLGVRRNERDKDDVQKINAGWGIGPFVALQPGTDNIIDAIGTGIMIGARRSNSGNDSFNLGIGAMVDINARTLGNGIIEDQPLPEGDTIRYKQRSQLGVLLMSSYSF